jgi:two-component system cell cycle response regulator
VVESARSRPWTVAVSRPALRLAQAFWVLALLVFAGHAAYTSLGVGRGVVDDLATQWASFAAFLACAGVCFSRARSYRRERAAWSVLGAGLLLYALGVVYYNLISANDTSPSFPSGADLLWLSLYPAALVAVALLVRSQRADARPDLWLDGVIGGFAVASVGVVVIFNLVLNSTADLHAAPANLAFALGDLLVVGFAVGMCGLLGWRPPRSLIVLIGGFVALGLQDTAYLFVLVRGIFEPGTLLDSCWLLAVLLIAAAAAWPRPAQAATTDANASKLVAFPLIFALVAVGLAAYEALADAISVVPVVLTTLTLLAVVVRFAVSFRAHLAMLEVSGRHALTDALTGLGNRRKLLRDADVAVADATAARPVMLAIFDLDGFKAYNDSYGHPAGDTLLARLGEKLAEAVAPWGEAYRLGGDEFCVLVGEDQLARRHALAAAAAALTEEGEAFTICSSYGSVVIPDEAQDVSDALARADQRLYAAKDSRPSAPARQAYDVLRGILHEREPELDHHHEVVARWAEAVGRRLGVATDELQNVIRAAELHDVGKIAIPDAILHKPGTLTAEEWEFMRRHPAIGARFLASIPSLSAVAGLVASSHERYDGKGYPAGLAGDDIPLGARIIFACDAYDAMTTDRAYRTAMTPDEAVAELRSHAGTQFDPEVVDALCAELASPDRAQSEVVAPGPVPSGERE